MLENKRDDRERVVVLGSGWAGYTFARRLDPKKYQAVIVSPRSHFVFTPLLASTSVGTLEFRTALEPVRSKRTQVTYFQGWADDVDFENKRVTIEEAVDDPNQGLAPLRAPRAGESPGERQCSKAIEAQKGQLFDIAYDKLIIAVGAYSQTFGTPGVKENALFLKDVGDARKIRNRMLACFETVALPTTSARMRGHLLNFAVVGGGPTGIEFSAELHNIIKEDMSRLYPELAGLCNITVYDVEPKVLPMFDEDRGKYAMRVFKREGIKIKTSHHVQELRRGLPKSEEGLGGTRDDRTCWTLRVREEGEVGVGMVVWSTGLMNNPFVDSALGKAWRIPDEEMMVESRAGGDSSTWGVRKHPKSGSITTNERLQVILEASGEGEDRARAVLKNVYALGDCAVVEGVTYPATAQVASQMAEWLAKRLDNGDVESRRFAWKNMGAMAYVGNWNAIMQGGGGGQCFWPGSVARLARCLSHEECELEEQAADSDVLVC